MITPKEIERNTMSPEKRKFARNDLFAFYVGRPISYYVTIPFLYANIMPNTISLISILPLIIGFVLLAVTSTKKILILAWFCYFIWNILDGVDGNVARYKKQFSKMGSVYDAMSGYLAMVFTFSGMGLAAASNPGIISEAFNIPYQYYIVSGFLAGIFMIFPRLIMFKAESILSFNNENIHSIKERGEYGWLRVIALNLSSVAGLGQVLMLISILINCMGMYVICYFLFNTLTMIVSLKSILKE